MANECDTCKYHCHTCIYHCNIRNEIHYCGCKDSDYWLVIDYLGGCKLWADNETYVSEKEKQD